MPTREGNRVQEVPPTAGLTSWSDTSARTGPSNERPAGQNRRSVFVTAANPNPNATLRIQQQMAAMRHKEGFRKRQLYSTCSFAVKVTLFTYSLIFISSEGQRVTSCRLDWRTATFSGRQTQLGEQRNNFIHSKTFRQCSLKLHQDQKNIKKTSLLFMLTPTPPPAVEQSADPTEDTQRPFSPPWQRCYMSALFRLKQRFHGYRTPTPTFLCATCFTARFKEDIMNLYESL